MAEAGAWAWAEEAEAEAEPVTPQTQPQLETNTPQTVSERRLLRSAYRSLNTVISGEMSTGDFYSALDTSSMLHKSVRRPREQMADANTLLHLATNLQKSVKSHSVSAISPSEFVSALLEIYGKPGSPDDKHALFDWAGLGHAVSPVFTAPQGCATMVGPMNTLVMKPPRAREKGTAKPCGYAHLEQLANPTEEETKTDTDKNMSAIFNLLRRKQRARLEHLVLNRTSFAQTAENIFALSFLVKDGRVEIDVNADGHHIVYPRNAPSASDITSGKVVYSQFVLKFDFHVWEVMKGSVPEGEELMPHMSSQDTPGAAGNRLLEWELPMPTQISPIKKDINLTYKRKRLVRNT